jgi:hypothetical protein
MVEKAFGCEMENGVRNAYEDTQEHPDLKWFRPPERNTVHPFLCIAPVGSYSTNLEEASAGFT